MEQLRTKERICAALVMLTLFMCMSFLVTHSAIAAPAAGKAIDGPMARALSAQVIITETPVTTNPAWQGLPAIFGDIIVWVDGRNGKADIYMYDISTGVETRVTTDLGQSFYPAIYGDIIV